MYLDINVNINLFSADTRYIEHSVFIKRAMEKIPFNI